MRSLRHIFVLLALLGVVSVCAPAAALADNCNSSAGDQQYVDPLQNCNSSPGSSGTHTTPSTPASTPAPATPSAPTPVATTASTTATTHSTDPSSAKTLPFTGLNLGAAMLVALGLLGGGLVLRRLAGAARSS